MSDLELSNIDEHAPIRVLIVDDHAVVRHGLKMFLDMDDSFTIVGEGVNGEQAVQLADQLQPDVILMDLLMPGMDGVTAIGIIKQRHPDIELIALTSVLEDVSVVGAVRAGAIGYLLKNTELPELVKSIKAAAEGQVQLSPKAAARLVREIRSPDSTEKLTEREIAVLRLVAQGKANKEIAHDLEVGIKTVKSHVSSILAKLGIASRTQAALYAARIGKMNSPMNLEISGLGS